MVIVLTVIQRISVRTAQSLIVFDDKSSHTLRSSPTGLSFATLTASRSLRYNFLKPLYK
nr:MAG TPA: hypothetical protein [Bacteriophage sp.]